MSESTAAIVQFAHPNPELVPPKGGWLPWNRDDHGRKFLASRGDLCGRDGSRAQDQDLAFWGEWEAGSIAEQRWSPEGQLPRALQRPVLSEPGEGWRQNTDPYVFGPAFRYSNCRQPNSLALQQLPTGSLILFGSKLGGRFVLDTMFVVGSSRRYTPIDEAHDRQPDVEEAFRRATIKSIASAGVDRAPEMTLYRGATPGQRDDGMYSFVPARPREGNQDCRFARPATELPGFVNPRNGRAARGASTRIPLAEVRHHWDNVVQQVLDAGLLLGTNLHTPADASNGLAD